MKKILLSVLCLFSIIAVHADEVTFVAQGASTDATNKVTMATGNIPDVVFSSTNVNLVLTQINSNASNVNSGGHVRWYKSDILNIVPTGDATITKVVFATTGGSKYCVAPVANTGEATADTGTNTITWEGAATDTLKLAADNGQIRFTTMNVTYTLPVSGATLETPTASLEPGVFYNTTSVELSASDGEIHYTLDGTEPTAESPVYSEAIAIDNFGTTTVVKAIAIDGEEFSEIATFSYNLQIGAPGFNFDSGVYTGFGWGTENGQLKVTSTITTGAKVYYTYTIGEETIEKYHYSTSANISFTETTSVTAKAYIIRTIGEISDTVYSEGVTKDFIISPIAPYKAATAITSGKKYAICANDTVIADYIFKSKTYSYLYTKNVEAKALTRKDGTESSKFIETNDFYGYTITETANAGEYTIQDPFGRYLYISGTYTSFNLTNDATSKGDAAIWTITFDANGLATITNKEKGNVVNYSTQYGSFGAYTTTSEDYSLPTLYELGSYPTLTFTPASDSTVENFTTFTVTCENGITNNESDELYLTYNWNTDYEYNYDENMFNYGEKVDNNTYTFTPLDEPYGNKRYTINIPEGIFTLDPGGYFETTNEWMNVNFEVKNTSILEVLYANPADQASVSSIQYLFFEFNQDIFDNVNGAAITDENGNSYPLTVTYTDEWGDATPYNALCLKTAEPITEPGTYTFVLSKDYIYAGTDTRMNNDVTYTFVIKEPLKIATITPADNSIVESLSEFTVTLNKSAWAMAEAVTVYDYDGNSYNFPMVYEDAEGNELPEGTFRFVAETPITAPGTYELYFEGYTFVHYGDNWESEYSSAQSFTYYIEASEVVGDVDGDGTVNVADVTKVVSIILGEDANDAADIDGDGTVNVADVTKIVTIILGSENASEAPAKAAATRADATSTVSGEGDGSTLLINVSNPSFEIAAIQFDLELPEGIEVAIDAEGFYDVQLGSRTSSRKHSYPECAYQADGSLRVVIVSMSNALFSGTEGDVAIVGLKVNGAEDGIYNYTIKNMTIASPASAKETLDSYTGEIIVANGTTGIDSITADGKTTDATIYDLQGRKVTETVKGGIYIKDGKKFIAE